MPWAPTTILRVEKNFPTGAGVVRVVTDQGDGYLKALGHSSGPHVLACEWIGTHIAKLIGLLTFDFALIEVTERDEIPFVRHEHGTDVPDGEAQPGPAFITRSETGQRWGGTAGELRLLANQKHLTRLVLLDTWIRNPDRHAPASCNRKPNRDNVFLSDEGAPAGKKLLKAMDPTHCISNGRALTPHVSDIDGVKDDEIYGLFPEFEPLLDRAEMTEAIADLKLVTRDQISATIATIPTAWQVDGATRSALADFLVGRAQYVADTLPSGLWPPKLQQSELEL